MRTLLLFTLLALISINEVSAQKTKKSKVNNNFYPVVVKFESVCCGVPGDAPLKNFLKKFKTENKIKAITAYKISPMGREGEYHLAFPMKEMNRQQRYLFKTRLNDVIPLLNDKGKADVELNMTLKKENLPSNAKITKVIF